MKHKIISITGIAVSILMALVGSLEVLYNYGTSGSDPDREDEFVFSLLYCVQSLNDNR